MRNWVVPSKRVALMIVLSLCFFAATSAFADELQVSQSGTLTDGDTFAYSFDTASNPTPTAYLTGAFFLAPITDFVLDINGASTGATLVSNEWIEPNGGGGYDDGPILNIYSTENMFAPGTEADPTILTGVYTSVAEGTVDLVGVKAAGDITIQAIEKTPEPGTFSLMLIGLGALGLVLVTRKRIALALPHAN